MPILFGAETSPGEYGIIGSIILAAGIGLGYAMRPILAFWEKKSQGDRETQEKRETREAEAEEKRELRDAEERVAGFKVALATSKATVARLENKVEQQENVIRKQQEALEAAKDESAECREDNAHSRATMFFLYEILKRLHKTLCDKGGDPGPMPDLPAPREKSRRRPEDTSEFKIRQAAQQLQNIGAAERATRAHERAEDETSGR